MSVGRVDKFAACIVLDPGVGRARWRPARVPSAVIEEARLRAGRHRERSSGAGSGRKRPAAGSRGIELPALRRQPRAKLRDTAVAPMFAVFEAGQAAHPDAPARSRHATGGALGCRRHANLAGAGGGAA